MKICPNCGYRNADTEVVCVNCNTPLTAGQNNSGNFNSAGGGNLRLWSFKTSLLITAAFVVLFIACAVALFNYFSGTTIGNVFRGIFDGIGNYYDNVKLFGK